MRIDVDREVCRLHLQCHMTAPSVFDLGENDELVWKAEVAEAQRTSVERAAAACPVSAIRVDG